jgi:SHS2 domain-containing protein
MAMKKSKTPKTAITAKSSAKNNTKNAKKEVKKENAEFEFLDHTADVKFRSYGKNFEEALENAGKATIQVITDIKKIKVTQKKQIKIDSKTKESLVYDFLEELIYLIDTEGFLAKEIKKIKIQKTKDRYILTADLAGDNAKSYDIHTQIKAVTYNDMKIEETKNHCMIQIVHDI